MLRWVLDLSKVRRARKAACAVISPMVAKSRHRLGEIPDAAWASPYVVGFMVMLITIIAKTEIGKIEGQTLCIVQAKAWEDITGIKSGLIGEDVLLLSAARNREFETGCHNAMGFASLLIGSSVMGWQHRQFDLGIHAAISWSDRDDLSSLWERLFDAHVSTHLRDIEVSLDRTRLGFS